MVLNGVACDGYVPEKKTAVVTHFHEDRSAEINKMQRECDAILLHPITYAALAALTPSIRLRPQFVPTDYDTPFAGSDYKVRLLRSNHIPGSCQVLVEHDGSRLLYSGDFNYPDVHVPKCDCLVLDATHGDPSYDYEQVDRREIMRKMRETVSEKTGEAESVVVRSSRGTLQYVIWSLEVEHEPLPADVVFVAGQKEIDVLAAIYGQDSDSMRKIVPSGSADARRAVSDGKTCVAFTSSMVYDRDTDGWFGVHVDRYKFTQETPGVFRINNGIRCNLSAHASYRGILQFVRDVDPQFVLVDSSRSRCATMLAERIRDELGIRAEPSDSREQGDP